MHLGKTAWKLKRLTAGQEELNGNDFFNKTKEFSLQENKVSSITGKAERKTFSFVDNHASFEYEIPKSAITESQEAIIRKLNLTSVTFYPYADNEDFSFEAIVQVEPKRPYSGWRDIDFYNIKIRSKQEVTIDTYIEPITEYIVSCNLWSQPRLSQDTNQTGIM